MWPDLIIAWITPNWPFWDVVLCANDARRKKNEWHDHYCFHFGSRCMEALDCWLNSFSLVAINRTVSGVWGMASITFLWFVGLKVYIGIAWYPIALWAHVTYTDTKIVKKTTPKNRITSYGNTGGLTTTSVHEIGGLCGLNSIAAQLYTGVFLGCARMHSLCGAPQVVKTGNPTGNINFLVWHLN